MGEISFRLFLQKRICARTPVARPLNVNRAIVNTIFLLLTVPEISRKGLLVKRSYKRVCRWTCGDFRDL